jgi:hypothetical protein
MPKDLSYAQSLRSIGQMLDALRIEWFSITVEADVFVVRDKTRSRSQLTPREKAFLTRLQSSRGLAQDKESARKLAAGIFEWQVTRVDLERLEGEEQAKRRSDSLTPESHSLPQVLRVVGGIIDQKRGRLISVSKDDQVVTLEYSSSSGQNASEEYTLPVLYDFWVRMYKRRTTGDNK